MRVSSAPGPVPPGHIQGLDGLRAVSVLAVLAYHARLGWAHGGYLGVEVFFVISGFLITSLLLKEQAREGRIDLGAFLVRRARRLLPAVLALLLGVALYGWLFLGEAASQFRPDLLASLVYAENWHQIASGHSYFADQGLPLLRHLWSLSVEEQFYLAWPLLVAGVLAVRRGRMLPAVVALLAAASGAWALHLAQPFHPSSERALESLNRVYLGTDTRALGLLLGALLAVVPPIRWIPDRAGAALDGLGAFALAALLVLMTRLEAQAPALYRGGWLGVDLLTLLVLASLVHPGATRMRRLLGWRPLEWVGRRSYGLYLWHWPLFRLLWPGQSGGGYVILRVALTFLLAELSYRFLEMPIRRHGMTAWFREEAGAPRWRPWAFRLGTLGLVVLAQVAGFGLARRPDYVDPVAASLRAASAALDRPGMAPAPSTSAEPLPPAALPGHLPRALEGVPPLAPPPRTVAMPEGFRGVHLTAIGDSVMKGAAGALKQLGERSLGKGQILVDAEESRPFSRALSLLRDYKQEGRLGEVVIIHLGTNNSSLPSDQVHRLMTFLADRRLVCFLTTKSDKPEACDKVNLSLGSLLQAYPNARLLDWKGTMDAHPECFYSDLTHLRPEGAQQYATFILTRLAELEARPTLAASPVAAPPPPGGGPQP